MELTRTIHELPRTKIKPSKQPTHKPTYKDSGCLHELFEAQVRLRPEALALVCGTQNLTYRELDGRANRLAHYLRSRGVGPGKFVGLYFERSAQPIVAILACLKAGAAYVPIDPTYPADRIRHIVTESELVLLLTESALAARAVEHFGSLVLDLDAVAADIALRSPAPLLPQETGVSPDDLCYVIYTSGTTGRPKGVMTEHRNAFKFTLAFNEVCGTSADDRVYQGFSLGFDGSVEEIWMAFSNGSALVVPGKDAPRFGNELGQYLIDNGVTYFSTVPTLLSTITDSIPTIGVLVVSGEICPQELVNRWARPGRRMLNVYGPTEATVNTTAAECLAGKAVTIGRPLNGYDLYILDAKLQPVLPGEKGELFVGGDTLARGYLKQPEVTARSFVDISGIDPTRSLRLYRTGDLVRQNDQGELEFFGRIDSQVKIRGYRVELAEIESILLELKTVRSVSVRLFEKDGLQELAAYIVLEHPAQELDRAEVLASLEARVPPYMIPGYLDILGELPMLSSGKVNRALLPPPVTPLVRQRGTVALPATELETKIAAVWARVFGLPQVSVEDCFFLDLGGHSLVAAQMITQLRRETGKRVTVRDAYSFSTVRKLAKALESLPDVASSEMSGQATPVAPSSKEVFEGLSSFTRMATGALQALSIYLLYGLGSIPFGVMFLLGLAWVEERLSLLKLIEAGALVTLLTWPLLFSFSIAAKWLIIGRYKPGKYPVWGFYYFRWWLVSRIQGLSGAGAFAGTPLLPLYYRLMGAKVGSHCQLDSAQCSIFDLVSIGDDTSIGADTQLLGYRVENGMLILGSVEIGSRCFLGIHSALGLNVRMGDDSRLDDQSLLPDHQQIASGESRRGSPAIPAEVRVPVEIPQSSNTRQPIFFGLVHFALLELMAILLVLPSLPILAMIYYGFIRGGYVLGCTALIASVPIGFLLLCLYIAALKRVLVGHAKPGVYTTQSLFYLRKWLSDDLMKFSRAVLLPLYTTMYLPPWLRLLGAKIGARAELSSVWAFSPELIEIGEESFFADGSIVGGKRFFRGRFEIGLNKIGRRSFVGNSAILPVGSSLGDGCLLGVQSMPPAHSRCTPDGSEWLGSPAFALTRRQKVGNFDEAVTFRPTRKLYLQRAVVDAMRILIPGYIALGAALAAVALLYLSCQLLGNTSVFATAPLIGLGLALWATLVTVAIKKAVMGTFKPVIVPLWSMYVWLNEMVNGIYESVMAPALAPLLGTPFVAPFLRLIGCKIGRHTFIESILFSEFDLVEVGDYAALNFGSIIQTHLFEDRVMKSSYLKIGEGCTVGNMAVMLYDSEMMTGSSLGPLSLLMKGETLYPKGRWHGIPTVQVLETDPLATLQRQSLDLHSGPSPKKWLREKMSMGIAASLRSEMLR